jgi:hypothetical protein
MLGLLMMDTLICRLFGGNPNSSILRRADHGKQIAGGKAFFFGNSFGARFSFLAPAGSRERARSGGR